MSLCIWNGCRHEATKAIGPTPTGNYLPVCGACEGSVVGTFTDPRWYPEVKKVVRRRAA